MAVGINKIESVIEEILTFPVKKGLDALKRREIVIKILKKFGIGTPGKDATFEHVYIYTLVEFGVGGSSLPVPKIHLNRMKILKVYNLISALKSNMPHGKSPLAAGEL